MISIKRAFTLAEVVIVVGIIGIIAEFTIPQLVQNVQYSMLIEKTKKEYSTLENALLAYRAENGVDDYVGLFTPGNTSAQSLNEFLKYLRVSKNCGGANTGCFDWFFDMNHDGTLRTFKFPEYARAILQDGTSIVVQQLGGDGNGNCVTLTPQKDSEGNIVGSFYQYQCANVWFDVNGSKPPNVDGQDMFGFRVNQNKLDCAWGKNSLQSVLFEGKLIIYNNDGTVKKKVP